MTVESLLPVGATRVERAIEAATARGGEVPVGLSALADFDRAPAEFLPFLAWGHSTDLWDRDWPVEKKRAAAKAWWRLHRLKGTLAGIEEAVRLFGGAVVGARVPPDATYPDPSLTRAERDAYLARFRQIRFYDFRSRGVATFGAYSGSGYRLSRLFAGGGFFPAETDAADRIGRRAFIFDPLTGEEEPVRRKTRVAITDLRGEVPFEQVLLPGRAGPAFFAGHTRPGRVFAVNTGSRGRVYSVAIDREYIETRSDLHISGVLPSDRPIDVRPRRVKVRNCRCVLGTMFPGAKAGRRAYFGRDDDGQHRTFLPTSTSRMRIFDQVFLFDPARLPDRRDARTFAGRTRLGQAPYHARLTIEVRGKASPFAFQRFVSGFLIKTSKKRLRQVIEATRLSKALRDKVLLTAKTMRPVTVADGARIGSIQVGALVRDV
jgi:phage tail-like protein